jgi:hypothetical protein
MICEMCSFDSSSLSSLYEHMIYHFTFIKSEFKYLYKVPIMCVESGYLSGIALGYGLYDRGFETW